MPPGLTWSVLVVNNNCTDDTDAVVASFSGRLPVRRAFEAEPGLSHARNRALDEARGDFILWIDDDVLVDEEWIVGFAQTVLRHPDALAVGGPIDPWFPPEADPDILEAFPFFRGLDHGPVEFVLAPDQPIYGGNMAIARRVIGELRFDTALGTVRGSGIAAEELDFVARLRQRGGSVVWSPRMRLKHYVPLSRLTLDYLVRYAGDRGRTFVRQSGVTGCPEFFGTPRWMWRLLMQRFASYQLLRFTPFRARALSNLCEFSRLRGMVSESRAHYQAEKRLRRSGVETRATALLLDECFVAVGARPKFEWLEAQSLLRDADARDRRVAQSVSPDGYVAVIVRLESRLRLARVFRWLTTPWCLRSAERRIARAGARPIGRFGAWPDAARPTFVYPLAPAAAAYAEAHLLPAPTQAVRWFRRAARSLNLCHPSLGAVVVIGRVS